VQFTSTVKETDANMYSNHGGIWSTSGKIQAYKYISWVPISSNLSWDNHVSNICSRAKTHMGMLYGHIYCDADSKGVMHNLCETLAGISSSSAGSSPGKGH